jgi:hypothetical protein
MRFEIKHRYNGSVLFALETKSFKLCVEAAVQRGVNLQNAEFQGANFRGADLQGAKLQGAEFQNTELRDAKLQGADLQDAEGINKNRCTPLTILLDQPGKIRAYKLVNRNQEEPYQGDIIYEIGKYEIGKSYGTNDVNTNDTKNYGAGINVATLDWCMKEWQEGYRILIVEFEAADIVAIPIATDGKFRLHRCKVVGEKDLKEIELVHEEAEDEQT